VWTGTEVLIWGGSENPRTAGARYDPQKNKWRRMSTGNAPPSASSAAAVWTGKQMLVWGGVVKLSNAARGGGRYDPAANRWSAISTRGAPWPSSGPTAVWTGKEMIVWGGRDGRGPVRAGGAYNPATDTWRLLPQRDAPAPRILHTSVWTGTEMIVWGGATSDFRGRMATGARFDPARGRWKLVSTKNAPSARAGHTAVWTGTEMIIWGGRTASKRQGYSYALYGAAYNPKSDTWRRLRSDGAPTRSANASAIWTGKEMIVWGGLAGKPVATGGRYKPK